MPVESVDSYPNGVGEIGNDGCLCHGESNQQTEMAKFTINGNAVNCNNQSNGDVWYRTVMYVPGVQNFDPIPNETQSEHELELFDRTMLIGGLIALIYICYRTIRD